MGGRGGVRGYSEFCLLQGLDFNPTNLGIPQKIPANFIIPKTRGPLVLYCSPECWRYAKISGYWGKNFYVNRKALSLRSFVASLKRISSTSDFIHIFSWFNKRIQPQVRGRQPQGTKFLCQQKPLVTSVIYYKFQRNLFEVWFYTFFFHDFIYVYSPGAGANITPWDEILMSTGTSCHFGHLLQVLKKSLWSLILYDFFHDLIHVYSLRQGQTAPRVQKFDVNRKANYHFTHLLQVWKKSLSSLI